ncbi:MAG: acyltransferase family protein, partial [Cetobacterium sp.]
GERMEENLVENKSEFIKINKKNYYNEITLAKGIGIILVILGHSFTFTGLNIFNDPINNYILRTIYSYHMPLFFLISGFLSNIGIENLNKKFYFTKIKRLMIPYFFINIIDAIPRYLFNDLVNNKSNSLGKVLLYSGAATWFVYTLFILFLIFPVLEKYIIKKDKYFLFGIFLIVLNFLKIGSNIELFTVNRLLNLGIYFYFGYILKPYYKKYYDKYSENIILYFIFIIGFLLLGNKYENYKLSYIFYPFLGIITTFLFSIRIKKNTNNSIFKFLYFCGENSLAFYLLESFCGTIYRVILIKFIPLEYNFLLVSSFFLLKLITLSLGVKFIITKNSVLSFLLGVKYNKSQIQN